MIYNARRYVLAVYHIIMIYSNASDMTIESVNLTDSTSENTLDLRTIASINSSSFNEVFRGHLKLF